MSTFANVTPKALLPRVWIAHDLLSGLIDEWAASAYTAGTYDPATHARLASIAAKALKMENTRSIAAVTNVRREAVRLLIDLNAGGLALRLTDIEPGRAYLLCGPDGEPLPRRWYAFPARIDDELPAWYDGDRKPIYGLLSGDRNGPAALFVYDDGSITPGPGVVATATNAGELIASDESMGKDFAEAVGFALGWEYFRVMIAHEYRTPARPASGPEVRHANNRC